MSGLGSLLLFCAWSTGLVAAFLTIRSFEEPVNPAGPRRRVSIALALGVVGTLWLPWVTSANGQFTSSGWLALDAATVVAVMLLAGGIAAVAALPDWGGARRELHSLLLSLSLLGIIAGNWLIASSGGWGVDLQWGAVASVALATALASVEGLHYLHGRSATRAEEPIDLTAELGRLPDLHTF
ncbi:MAG: hypothetical protein JNK12_12105 [Acidimicrobiales bacterium]|nr:hypothetical protein [Acidimicrobiales bacterium]